MSDSTNSPAEQFTIDREDPSHLRAIADFVEEVGFETLKLAKRPYETLLKTLSNMASEIEAEREIAEVRQTIVSAAEVAYDNADPDQLSNPGLSWDDLTAEDKRSWCASTMAVLKSVGAISLTEEQSERILATSVFTAKAVPADPETEAEPESDSEDPDEVAESDTEAVEETPADETEAEPESDTEADSAGTDVVAELNEETLEKIEEVDTEELADEVPAEQEATQEWVEEEQSDTRAAVLDYTPQPVAAPVAEPEAPQVSEEIRAQALAAQQSFGTLGMPPAPVNPPYPAN